MSAPKHVTSKNQRDLIVLKNGDRKAATLNPLVHTLTNARKGYKIFFQGSSMLMKLCRLVCSSLLKISSPKVEYSHVLSWISESSNNISVLLLVVRTQEKAKPETLLRKIMFLWEILSAFVRQTSVIIKHFLTIKSQGGILFQTVDTYI